MFLKKLNEKYPKKRAFITGAASGLGSAFAKLLASEHWELHLADMNLETLEAFSETLSGSKKYLYAFDVSDRQAYEKAAHSLDQHTSGIDLVINNAGIGDGELFENYEMDQWERMIQVNLLGVYYGCHYFISRLLEQKKGSL